MESRFPVSRIWISNQPGAEPERIDLSSGTEQLLIRCASGGLEFHRLRAGEFALAQACYEGAELGTALEAALQVAPTVDLARALQRLFAAGAFLSF